MASYTDIIPKFNPYISQLPVEAMVAVGMEKQKRYDEGVQKLQSYIDTVAGLEIMRPQDKAYLQSKLNELGNNLRTVAAGDFSNFQLVNSVGGMIGQVGKDKFVQAAVQSTAWDKQQRALMEEDRKKGTLAPENEANYSKKLRSYYESGIKDEYGNPIKFNSNYIPHFDVFKFAKETFDAVKPDGMTWDQVYETDANGKPKIDPKTGEPIFSPVMIRMEKEGIFPQKVKDTLDQIFSDPRVSQQLNITGEYNFGGLDSQRLREKLAPQKQATAAAYEDAINELSLKKNLAKTSTEKDNIQTQIDKLQNALDNVNSNYAELEKLANTNPDYVRGYLYKNDVKERYTSMFGKTVVKQTTMSNPGWEAAFKLKQEANEQDRWLKRLQFDDKWKTLEYEQKERLAKRKGAKLDADGNIIIGGGGTGVEQADEPSDIDMLYQLDADYGKAASEFNSSSDNFVWEMVFANNPNNQKTLNDLMAKGNTKDKAIGIILQNSARNNKQSLEEYLTYWGTSAERAYNKIAPNDVPPELKDSYKIYKASKRDFENMSAIKKKVDEYTEANLGSTVSKQILTTNIKPQKVKLYGNEYTLSPDDIYDLAVYLRGNQSSVGFLNDAGARKAAKAAEERIRARGNEPLLETVLRQNVTSGGPLGIITMATRTLGTPTRLWRNVSDGIRSRFSGDTEDDVDLSQVMDIYNKIDNDEFTNGIAKKAEIIRNVYGKKPNVKMGVLTGDAETDRATLYDLKRFGGAYTTGQKQNMSPDMDKFITSLSNDAKDLNLETQVVMDVNNNPQIEIVSYGTDGKRLGGMTIQPDEAASIGIDVNSLYEPRQVSLLRNYMNVKGNQTSSGDPRDVSTYVQGDAYFEKPDFVNMQNTPYDIKANVKFANGVYYGYLYVNDGVRKPKVYSAPGLSNLTDAYLNLIQNATPAWAEKILTQQ